MCNLNPGDIEFRQEENDLHQFMKIRIIEAIDDPFLKSEWERLEKENDIFPQNTYRWCSAWWKYLAGKRKLHIVVALDDAGNAITIAPLCIERDFGIPVLRSIPVNFGDFYTFITPLGELSQAGTDSVLEYMASNKLWQWVRLEQVSEQSVLSRNLLSHNYREKWMTGCVIANFNSLKWVDYLSTLKKSFRKALNKRLKRIDECFSTGLTIVRTWEEYKDKFNEMAMIHQERWTDDHVPAKGTIELACWKDAIRRQFEAGKMVYYELLCDNIPVAYSLGFLHRGVYYSWHTSFRPDYRIYHPGVMIHAFMIRQFIDDGIFGINFMAGEYEYKLDWSPDRITEKSCMFTSVSKNLAALFLNCYYHNVRDKLKRIYHRFMQYRLLRAVSRSLMALWQKMSGVR